MPEITTQTRIKAPIQTCFDLSRSIDLHQVSTRQTNEKAIAGKTSGLIELNETVTWQAKHFGISQQLTSKITAFNSPNYFVDEQVKGAFKSFYHKHSFIQTGDFTEMTDEFTFESPLGILGKLFNVLVLKNYMKRLLEKRNQVIKDVAESEEFLKYINIS